MKQLLLALFLILVLGCSNDLSNDLSVEVQKETDFSTFLEISNIEQSEEGYIYEKDVALTYEEVQAAYNNYLKTSTRGNYRDPQMKWKDEVRFNLTYKFTGLLQTSDLGDAEVKEAFREATRRWMDVAGVKFIEVDSDPLFTVTGVTSGDYYAISFFPNENTFGENKKVIKLNRMWAPMAYNTYEKMVGLFTHELGHALGLAHEHQRRDSLNTYGQRKYGVHFGNYDHDSIMDYGNKPYLNGISQGDIAAISNLYPNERFVIVYEDANYKGRSYKIRQGKSISHLYKIGWTNKISSVRCFNGAAVNLYRRIRFRGDRILITKDISNLRDNDFNNIASSLHWNVPTHTFMIAYEHSNFKGESVVISGNISQVPLNDKFSSIEIYNGWSGRLYEDSNFKGSSKFVGISTRAIYQYPGYTDLTWSKSYLEDFNDITSSVVIY